MGEVDTKPMRSVQDALALFGEKNDHTKDVSSNSDELERDEELQGLLKGLANLKVQLEAKDSAYKQATLKHDQYDQKYFELSVLLENSNFEKDFYINECKEARKRNLQFEDQIDSTKEKLLKMEMDLAYTKKAKSEDMKKEMEINQLRLELGYAKEEVKSLEYDYKKAKVELEKFEIEEQRREKEIEVENELANLKSEILKAQSKIAEVEISEIRLKSENSSLYIAVRQLGLEVEEAKNENKVLKKMKTETDNEVKYLIENTKNRNQVDNESEILKNDLKIANMKIGELRARAEQATSRAEVAEKGKAELERRIMRWKTRREKRKSALAALREEESTTSFLYDDQDASTSTNTNTYNTYNQVTKTYQPLYKVLDMKF